MRYTCVPDGENQLRASHANSSDRGRFAELVDAEKRNGPGVPPDRFKIADLSGVPATLAGVSGTIRAMLQARRAVRRLLELEITIADDEALPPGRDHLVELYRECWGILEASAAIIEEEFADLFGVSFQKFSFAINAVGWELLSIEARRRRTRQPGGCDWFISPAEIGQ